MAEQWPPLADYPSSNGSTTTVRSDGFRRLVVLAYIMAAAMPPLGFLLGIAVTTRRARRSSVHGASIIAVSIIAALIWILLLTSGALSTASNGY